MGRKDSGVLLALILIAIVIVACYMVFFRLSLVAGPEGPRALNYGVQFGVYDNVRVASRLDELPGGFKWVSNQPTTMIIKHEKDPGEPLGGFMLNGPGWWYEHDNGAVRVELERPRLEDDPIGMSYPVIEYYKYVQKSATEVEIRKYVVRIIPADFKVQISAVRGSGVYTWKNVNLWICLDTVTWMNAYASQPPPDPNPLTNETVKYLSGNYRGAFPIIAWIGQYQGWVWEKDDGAKYENPPDLTAPNFCQLAPDLRGRFIDLYTKPGTRYELMLSADKLKSPELIAEALKPDALPDPRFAETVYFYITLVNFGAYVQPLGGWPAYYSSYAVWYPSVFYRLRVVYAVWGEYVYLWTKKTAEQVGYTEETWQVRVSEKGEEYTDPFTAFIRSIQNWLANPANIIGLAIFFIALIAIIFIIALFWFFGAPKRGKS